MNLRNILKAIVSLTLLLTAFVVYEGPVTKAGAARPSSGSMTAARSPELALCGGPIGMSRAGSDGGPIGRQSGGDGGPIGEQAGSEGGPIG